MAKVMNYALPTRLYRYRSLTSQTGKSLLDRELSAIVDAYVYCPHFKDMNDPMEGAHRESAIFKNSKKSQARRDEMITAIGSLGVASFSETHKSEPMWAYYADSFKGICIEYSFYRLRSRLDDEHEFVRMLYNEEPPLVENRSFDADVAARMALSAKNFRWAPEREWRLIRETKGQAKYRKRDTVKSIYLGSRISSENRAEILLRMKPLSIKVHEMNVEKYQTSFRLIQDKSSPHKKIF